MMSQKKNHVHNYGKENSLEISGMLISVTVEGIGGDIFCQLKIYDVLEFMFASE
jgi:hypothetical protein